MQRRGRRGHGGHLEDDGQQAIEDEGCPPTHRVAPLFPSPTTTTTRMSSTSSTALPSTTLATSTTTLASTSISPVAQAIAYPMEEFCRLSLQQLLTGVAPSLANVAETLPLLQGTPSDVADAAMINNLLKLHSSGNQWGQGGSEHERFQNQAWMDTVRLLPFCIEISPSTVASTLLPFFVDINKLYESHFIMSCTDSYQAMGLSEAGVRVTVLKHQASFLDIFSKYDSISRFITHFTRVFPGIFLVSKQILAGVDTSAYALIPHTLQLDSWERHFSKWVLTNAARLSSFSPLTQLRAPPQSPQLSPDTGSTGSHASSSRRLSRGRRGRGNDHRDRSTKSRKASHRRLIRSIIAANKREEDFPSPKGRRTSQAASSQSSSSSSNRRGECTKNNSSSNNNNNVNGGNNNE